jgi:NAD(P) transhydrogenase
MASEKFDLVVIGSGPAGEKGAVQAAYFGKKVAVIEREPVPGGACANTGTLPSKTLRESAVALTGIGSMGLSGVTYKLNSTVTARQLFTRLHDVIATEHERIRHNLARHKVELIRGIASFSGPGLVEVRNIPGGSVVRVLQYDKALIATGSSPFRPAGIPFNAANIWDSNTVLLLDRIPESLVIYGAGVIGTEYASIFGALGCRVTLLEARDRGMPFLDDDVWTELQKKLAGIRVNFQPRQELDTVAKFSDRAVVVMTKSGMRIDAEAFLYAAGRNGNSGELALDRIGVTPDKRGYLAIDHNFQTSAPNVHAAGDIVGFPSLASVSMDQARIAVCAAFGFTYRQSVAEQIPMGIYTIPEVSSVGETEASARARNVDFVVGVARLEENARARIRGEGEGLLKLIFEVPSNRLIGAHMVSERASDLITPALFALRSGSTLEFFIDTVFNFPTLCEAYKMAAYDALGKLAQRGVETSRTTQAR